MRQRTAFLLLFLWIAAAAALPVTAWAVRAVNPVNVPLLQARETPPVRTDAGGPLDLNTAAAAELETLPGVGPALAENILAAREENGPFRSEEDVLAVPGIGPGVYEKILPYITY